MKKKILVIPIEIQSRELEGALLLAHEAIEREWIILIGQKQKIFPILSNIKNSFFFVKSIVPGEISLLKLIKKNNNFLSSLDVEALITANINNSLKQRYNYETLNLADLIFFWGENHFNQFCKTFEEIKNKNSKKFIITGSPIIDVVNLKKKKLKKENCEKKILIIPSFGFANSSYKIKNINLALDSMGEKNLISEFNQKKTISVNKELVDYLKLNYESQNYAMRSFKKLVIHLSKELKNFNITIRPHPMEKKSDWYECKKHNVRIDDETNLLEQINTNNTIIHFNSTVSIQSVLMKKKTILFFDLDKKFKKVINPILKDISIISNSYNSLVKLINDKIENNNYNSLNRYVKFTKFEKNLNASKLIIDELEKSKATKIKLANIQSNFPNVFQYYISMFLYELKNYIVIYILSFFPFLKKFSHGKIIRQNKKSRADLIKEKWPIIKKEILKKKLDDLVEMKNEKNLNIKVQKYFENTFIIHKE